MFHFPTNAAHSFFRNYTPYRKLLNGFEFAFSVLSDFNVSTECLSPSIQEGELNRLEKYIQSLETENLKKDVKILQLEKKLQTTLLSKSQVR